MEYPNQRGLGRGRDISPTELSPMMDLSRLSMPHDMTEEGCGCESTPENSMPEAPSCCAPTCYPCGENSWGLNGYPLAMVYAPCQAFRHLYDLDTALERGTLFSELDLPIETAGGVRNRGGCGCGRTNGQRG